MPVENLPTQRFTLRLPGRIRRAHPLRMPEHTHRALADHRSAERRGAGTHWPVINGKCEGKEVAIKSITPERDGQGRAWMSWAVLGRAGQGKYQLDGRRLENPLVIPLVIPLVTQCAAGVCASAVRRSTNHATWLGRSFSILLPKPVSFTRTAPL